MINAELEVPGLGPGYVRNLLPLGLGLLTLYGTGWGVVAAVLVLLDGLSMDRHPKRPTWHDRMVGTYVEK